MATTRNRMNRDDDETVSVCTEVQEEISENDTETEVNSPKEPKNTLEHAIMSWTKTRQQEYCRKLKQPVYETKLELASRITSRVSIKEAVNITRDYRRKAQEMSTTQSSDSTDKVIDITEADIENMELALKGK